MRALPRLPAALCLFVLLALAALPPRGAQAQGLAPAADPAAATAPLALPPLPHVAAGLDAPPADWRAANQAVTTGANGHEGHGDHPSPAASPTAPSASAGSHSHHGHGAEARP
ncbi:hypothetical protein [Paracidovorax wautersii]|uniref:Uncharacterized protein n=1 Tax=Paracidovorax wautersii TaxID=1177982 RepID=A0A1I1ZEV5_9BURK|nr:hypothetical protein [Paracidovorax wautersii]SFE28860.1 hypothetical protein SAMN04489711_10130 [Paracidovorax wautersii]